MHLIHDWFICITESVVSSDESTRYSLQSSSSAHKAPNKAFQLKKITFLLLFLFVCLLFLRMTKALTEADGPSWREKLPPIPTVPLSVREKLTQQSTVNTAKQNSEPQQNSTRQTQKPGKGIYAFHQD